VSELPTEGFGGFFRFIPAFPLALNGYSGGTAVDILFE
jgi:hypothetical protein